MDNNNSAAALERKANWHGPRQMNMIFYTGIMMLLASCLAGGSTNTILPAICAQNGWDIDFMRTMAGIGAMCSVIGVFTFGTVIAKKGAKFAITLALFVTAACVILYGYAPTMPIFVGMIFVIGFLSGGYNGAGANTLTANWWPTKKGIVLGFSTMAIPLMDIVWQPFIPQAFGRFGVGPTMVGVAVIVVILAVICITRIKNTPEEANEFPDGDPGFGENMAAVIQEMREYKSPFTAGKVFFSRATFDVGLGLGLCYMCGMSYIASIVPRLLSLGYEYPFAVIVLMVCGGGFGIFGSYLTGMLDQKFGTKRATMIFSAVMALGMVLALCHGVSVIFVWCAGAVYSSMMGGLGNLIPSYVITIFGRWDYIAAWRIIGAITFCFAGVGIMMTGLFHGNFTAMYIFNIVCLVVAFIILTNSKDKMIGKAG